MRSTAFACAVFLAGCQVQVGVPGPIIYAPNSPADECGSHRFQWLVGRPYTDLYKIRLNQPYRVLRTNIPSVRPASGSDTLVVVVDQTQTIIAVYCD